LNFSRRCADIPLPRLLRCLLSSRRIVIRCCRVRPKSSQNLLKSQKTSLLDVLRRSASLAALQHFASPLQVTRGYFDGERERLSRGKPWFEVRGFVGQQPLLCRDVLQFARPNGC